jgi:outer membrane biosynthesis protein TonB
MFEDSRRRLPYAIAFSMIAHAALLAIPARRAELLGPAAPLTVPMLVQLVAREPEPQPQAQPPQVAAAPQRVPVRPEPVHRPVPVPTPRPLRPEPIEKPEPVTPSPPVAEPQRAPPIDMMAILRQRREQRVAQDRAAREANAREPTPDQMAAAAIERNLRFGGEGVSGVFQLLHVGTLSAEYAFNGWRGDSTQRWRQVIEVQARPGEDIERAVVRSMIALIRTHYSGDFNWESHRLGRVFVLSARPEDNAGLEDFLVREFFGTPVLKQPG